MSHSTSIKWADAARNTTRGCTPYDHHRKLERFGFEGFPIVGAVGEGGRHGETRM